MGNVSSNCEAVGTSWRSSKWFILSTIAVALFAETFHYGFLVPMLPYMLETRIGVPHHKLQSLTSLVLAIHGMVSVVSGPIIGHLADKTPNRKLPLQLSLLASICGTGMIAGATSLAVLIVGRVMQGIAGSSVWIIGLATVADTVGGDNMGKVEGVMMSLLYSGLISGPLVSGLLLEHAGYWATWSLPIVLLIVDICARLIMIESRHVRNTSNEEELIESAASDDDSTPLIRETQDGSGSEEFWHIILTDKRALTALLMGAATMTVGTSFHATLPIYIKERFGWGPQESGVLFACLVMPALMLSPVAGWPRDRFGARFPAMGSAICQCMIFGIMGFAGTEFIPWTAIQYGGGILYTVCVLAIGIARPFTTNVGTVELSAVVKEYQEESPGIFGPDGGMSRIFSLDDVAASLGTVLGPIVGGYLKESFGYRFMCWTWSVLYAILTVPIMLFLSHK